MTIDERSLGEIFLLPDKVGFVPFPLVVKVSSGYEVIPVNKDDPKDKALITMLNDTFKAYLSTLEKMHGRLEGNRVNEVGSRIEGGLVHELERTSLNVRQLGQKGYPDIEIIENEVDRLTYLEVKVSAAVSTSHLRYFYYSSGEKIKGNARHLLMNIAISKVPLTANMWKIERFAISDLSRLSVELKTEFNASQRMLANKDMEILHSEDSRSA